MIKIPANMLSFEFEQPREQEPCPCCGGRTTALTRFVHKDGDAHAVYLATFSKDHPEKVVSLAVGLGEWGEGASPSNRVAFYMQLRCTANGFAVTIVDGSTSPWSGAAFLGRFLPRDEALSHPLIQEAFHLTDHIVAEDEAIYRYLEAGSDA